jgi:hypothetical protein
MSRYLGGRLWTASLAGRVFFFFFFCDFLFFLVSPGSVLYLDVRFFLFGSLFLLWGGGFVWWNTKSMVGRCKSDNLS